jgi:hypothetical protein
MPDAQFRAFVNGLGHDDACVFGGHHAFLHLAHFFQQHLDS